MAPKMCLKGVSHVRLRLWLWHQKAKQTKEKITKNPSLQQDGSFFIKSIYFKAKLVAQVLPFSSFNS